MGKVKETDDGKVILEKCPFQKESKSKKYKVYGIKDDQTGVIITLYLDSTMYNLEDEVKVKIKL